MYRIYMYISLSTFSVACLYFQTENMKLSHSNLDLGTWFELTLVMVFTKEIYAIVSAVLVVVAVVVAVVVVVIVVAVVAVLFFMLLLLLLLLSFLLL